MSPLAAYNPYLEAAGSLSRVEFFPVALEFRPSRRLMSRFWQRLVPNREPSPPDRCNLIALGKHRVSLFRNQTAPREPWESFRLEGKQDHST
jgi:hypothetical protein